MKSPGNRIAMACGLLCLSAATAAGAEWAAPEKALLGVWDGRVVLPPAGQPGDNEFSRRLAESLRLEFEFQARHAVLNLSWGGQPAETLRVTWRVERAESGVDELVLTRQTDAQRVIRKLELDPRGADEFLAREANGDPRMPPLRFTRRTAAGTPR